MTTEQPSAALKKHRNKQAVKDGEIKAPKFYVPPSKVTEDQLNDCARMLLDQVPDHATELMDVLSAEYRIPLWHVVCGQLLAAHLDGRLSAFQLDPAWRDGLRQQVLRCDHCGGDFKPWRIAQKYCSPDCGNAAHNEKIAEEKRLQERAVREREVEEAKKRLAETDKKPTEEAPKHEPSISDGDLGPGVREPDPAKLPLTGGLTPSAGWEDADELLA